MFSDLHTTIPTAFATQEIPSWLPFFWHHLTISLTGVQLAAQLQQKSMLSLFMQINEGLRNFGCRWIWQGCHSAGRSYEEVKNQNAQENEHNFGMIKEVFIKIFHDFILNIQNKKWCQLICETPARFSLYCLRILKISFPRGYATHHKMAFFLVGRRGRAGLDGILKCTMIDMQDCYPI